MGTIISLETSTKICSVALSQNGEILANIDLSIEHAHSEKLTLLIKDSIAYAGLSLNDIDAFAVAMGPGSYTGLRIGVATVKGFCYALEKPLLAINTLEAMAYQLTGIITDDYWLCPMLDARRMEVYCAIYDKELNSILPTCAKIIDENSFQEQLASKPILFFGNGAAKCKPKMAPNIRTHFLNQLIHPSAKTIGILAERAYQKKQFENLAYFEPFYLKEFVSKIV